MKNLIKISTLMLFENGFVSILRLFVGIKAFLSQDESKIGALFNFVLPVIFAIIWLNVRDIASEKNGFYGAPLSLMAKYEQQKQVLRNNESDESKYAEITAITESGETGTSSDIVKTPKTSKIRRRKSKNNAQDSSEEDLDFD